MVLSNKGSPDPDNLSEDLVPNNELIMVSDTDTDEDDNNPYNEYEPLPMNDFDENDDEESEDDSDPTVQEDTLPSIVRAEDSLVKEVWAGPAPKVVDIEMDNDKVNEIKLAMTNITLPASSIPNWAKMMPKSAWEQNILRIIREGAKSDK